MSIMEKIEEFNKRFWGKDVWSCDYLDRKTLLFHYFGVSLCNGACFHDVEVPLLCEKDENVDKIDKDFYINGFIDNFKKIQEQGELCRNCKFLRKSKFIPIDYKNFKLLQVNNGQYTKCNQKCVYCGLSSNCEGNDAFVVLKRFIADKLIAEGTEVYHSYGEPTLHKDFAGFLGSALEVKAANIIFSNSLLFSDTLYNSLQHHSDKTILITSVDCGTAETFSKIKGVDGFDIVWKNIKKYCETDGEVIVKYVVFSYTSSQKDLDEFIKKCVEANARKVMISAEAAAYATMTWKVLWEFSDYEFNACSYLLDACEKNNIEVMLDTNLFRKDDLDRINSKSYCYINKNIFRPENAESTGVIYYDELFKNNMSNNFINCIFGFGVRGKQLYESITRLTPAKISCFCDNSKQTDCTEYNIPCISVNQAASINNIRIFIPTGVYQFEMKQQLEDLGFENYVIV